MRQFFPVEELARDERFHTISNRERMGDPRTVFQTGEQSRRSNPGEESAGRVCDHGHTTDSHQDPDDAETCDGPDFGGPTSLLHGFLGCLYRGRCSYPQALSTMGMNHTHVIG